MYAETPEAAIGSGPARRHRKLLKFLVRSIGVSAFVVLLVYFWPEVRSAWREIRWGLFAAGCALFPVEMVFRAQRFRILTRHMVGAVSYRFAYAVYLAGSFFGAITPGRVGEFAKVHYVMREKGASASQALRPTLVDRLFDMLCLIAVGVVGWAVLGIHRIQGVTPVKVGGIAALGVIVLTGPVWARLPIRALSRARWLRGRAAKLMVWMDETLASFYTRLGAESALLTLCAYAVGFFKAWLVARSAGIDEIPFPTMCVIMAAISLAMLLPISVSGFGTREAAAIFLMGRMYGVAQERAMNFSLLYFASVNLFGALVGLAFWLAMPSKRREGFKKSVETIEAEMARNQ